MSNSDLAIEGQKGSCPKCEKKLSGDPLLFVGTMVCTTCDAELWFLKLGVEEVFYVSADSVDYQSQVLSVIGKKLKHPADQIIDNRDLASELDYDSLEMIELAMEIEDELR